MKTYKYISVRFIICIFCIKYKRMSSISVVLTQGVGWRELLADGERADGLCSDSDKGPLQLQGAAKSNGTCATATAGNGAPGASAAGGPRSRPGAACGTGVGHEQELTKQEQKHMEAIWELVQCELAFLLEQLMVLKHVRFQCTVLG